MICSDRWHHVRETAGLEECIIAKKQLFFKNIVSLRYSAISRNTYNTLTRSPLGCLSGMSSCFSNFPIMQKPALKEGGLKESSNCTKAQYEINKGYIDI